MFLSEFDILEAQKHRIIQDQQRILANLSRFKTPKMSREDYYKPVLEEIRTMDEAVAVNRVN